MKRVAIVGSGGAGKSRLATLLGARTGLPVIHLDREFWRPGWVPTPDDEWAARVSELVQGDRWIIDGNYGGTMESRLARADTVLFLDLPRLVCLWAVTRRALRYWGRSRPDMGPGVNEKLSAAFLRWVWDYPEKSRPDVLERIARLPPQVNVIRFRSRRAVRHWLMGVPRAVSPADPAGRAEVAA